jgi:serpin B
MAHFGEWFRELLGRVVNPNPDPSSPSARPRPSGLETFAEDNNDFALAIYEQLRQRSGNLFFSPFSIRIALGMTQAGARGETAAQMGAALRMVSYDQTPHDASAEIIQRLNAAGGGAYEMAVANSLWGQKGAPLEPAFVDLIARSYGAGMYLVDFRGDGETACVTINQWVEDTTRQKIRELIPAGSLNALTRLVLVNAVYFKGRWVLPFPMEATRDEPFHVEGGGKVRAPLMRQQKEIRYLQAEGYQAVELAYRGGDLSMLVLLPDRKDGLRHLEKRLTARMLHECRAQMSGREVKLWLPRFTITWGSVNLRDQLAALGMPLAFDPFQADFSGINGQEPPHEESVFISAVFHKTFVEVNEEGTEAAAATAVTMMLRGRPPVRPPRIPTFRADHPFLFAICERETGAIVFLGRVADPRLEN